MTLFSGWLLRQPQRVDLHAIPEAAQLRDPRTLYRSRQISIPHGRTKARILHISVEEADAGIDEETEMRPAMRWEDFRVRHLA